jgi:hypothetical protein
MKSRMLPQTKAANASKLLRHRRLLMLGMGNRKKRMRDEVMLRQLVRFESWELESAVDESG